jgi:hypothetical protein
MWLVMVFPKINELDEVFRSVKSFDVACSATLCVSGPGKESAL